jgi:hypothetical protein
MPGDTNTPDLPLLPDNDPRESAKKALLSHFNSVHLPGFRRPHHARVVGDDETVLLEIMATGPDTVEEV